MVIQPRRGGPLLAQATGLGRWVHEFMMKPRRGGPLSAQATGLGRYGNQHGNSAPKGRPYVSLGRSNIVFPILA